MQRITVSLDDELVAAIDSLMAERGYENRSEAFRDMLRDVVARARVEADPAARCVATLSYVFDHERRDLAHRLTHAQHHRHDLAVSTLHVHLDHGHCLEVSVLRGAHAEVRALADQLTTERGVAHAHLHVIPATGTMDMHGHGDGHGHHHHHAHPHEHD